MLTHTGSDLICWDHQIALNPGVHAEIERGRCLEIVTYRGCVSMLSFCSMEKNQSILYLYQPLLVPAIYVKF